jgi:hypothetical protein
MDSCKLDYFETLVVVAKQTLKSVAGHMSPDDLQIFQLWDEEIDT